jgi:hypothetical protein
MDQVGFASHDARASYGRFASIVGMGTLAKVVYNAGMSCVGKVLRSSISPQNTPVSHRPFVDKSEVGRVISEQIEKSANPLNGTRYSDKVLHQMQNNLKTGRPEFHGFPRIVDNYANFGRKELIKGKDGLSRTKVSVDGGYKGRDGDFEWIIESDKSII